MGKDVLETLNDLGTNADDAPYQRVTVTKCGACNRLVRPSLQAAAQHVICITASTCRSCRCMPCSCTCAAALWYPLPTAPLYVVPSLVCTPSCAPCCCTKRLLPALSIAALLADLCVLLCSLLHQTAHDMQGVHDIQGVHDMQGVHEELSTSGTPEDMATRVQEASEQARAAVL